MRPNLYYGNFVRPKFGKNKKILWKKFSTTKMYKIGRKILRCLKYIRQLGYLYIDLKENNIAILCNSIVYRNKINNLLLINYGFCEKFNKDEKNHQKCMVIRVMNQ